MLYETGSSEGVEEYRKLKQFKSPEELQDSNFGPN